MIYIFPNKAHQETLENACESLNAIGSGVANIVHQAVSSTTDLIESFFSLGVEKCPLQLIERSSPLIEPHVPVPSNMGKPVQNSTEDRTAIYHLYQKGWGNSTLSTHGMSTLTARVAQQLLASGNQIPQNDSLD